DASLGCEAHISKSEDAGALSVELGSLGLGKEFFSRVLCRSLQRYLKVLAPNALQIWFAPRSLERGRCGRRRWSAGLCGARWGLSSDGDDAVRDDRDGYGGRQVHCAE